MQRYLAGSDLLPTARPHRLLLFPLTSSSVYRPTLPTAERHLPWSTFADYPLPLLSFAARVHHATDPSAPWRAQESISPASTTQPRPAVFAKQIHPRRRARWIRIGVLPRPRRSANDRWDIGDVLGFCVFARGSRREIERNVDDIHGLAYFKVSAEEEEALRERSYRMEKP